MCRHQLSRDLQRTKDDVFLPGERVIIRLVGVRNTQLRESTSTVNTVRRQNSHAMRQKEDEAIMHILAQLRARAKLSEFTVICSNEVCQGNGGRAC